MMIRVGLGRVILIPLSVPFSHGMVAMRLMLSLGITIGKFGFLHESKVLNLVNTVPQILPKKSTYIIGLTHSDIARV